MNLAESFYLAMPNVSWQTIVVGDPLCARSGRPPGRPRSTRVSIRTRACRSGSPRDEWRLSRRGLNPVGVKAFLKAQVLLTRGDQPGGAPPGMPWRRKADLSRRAAAGRVLRAGKTTRPPTPNIWRS